ncbi:MAG: SF1B family DNA helicase RecD2 [Schwartzia sp. (in: firmicutes)]
MENLKGSVESVIFESGDGRFSVFRLRPEGRHGLATATLPANAPLVGQDVLLGGAWVRHPRFGEQFKAEHIQLVTPSTALGIERFLASGLIEGIGAAMAHRIVAQFGEEALSIIENAPHRLKEVAGIGAKTMEKITASYRGQSELRDIMLWLENHGVSGALAARIYKQYGSFALEVLARDPYRMAREVPGIGFATADRIAMSADIPADDPARVAAGVEFTLFSIAADGHSCIPEPLLAERGAKLLGVSRAAVAEAVAEGLQRERLYAASVGAETFIYPAYLYRAECEVAEKLRYLQKRAEILSVEEPEALAADWEAASGLTLAEGQRRAVAAALRHGIFVLTGGPGTGKTTVIQGMIAVLEKLGLVVRLGAPTGRAAKRLSAATGRPAATVHRLLEAQGAADDTGAAFARSADDPIEADVIILDEVSMMDIVLTAHFLAAVPPGCHVIFVGDADQLPSVGPGAVLKEILRSKAVPSLRLTDIFRQAQESVIVRNAHAINAGRLPDCASGSAFTFLATETEEETAAAIVELCAEELPRAGWDVWRDVQVLSPMHRQSAGVDNLNRLLQGALNPPEEGKRERSGGWFTYRVGDKVMQTKNNYQKKVFNGDTGRILAIDEEKVQVLFEGGLTAAYTANEMSELSPAYAMSVHKSQGSEYPVILLPLLPSHRILLQRNLLYTAVTRAKERVILLGSRKALRTAVENDRTRRRGTLLAERLAEALDG